MGELYDMIAKDLKQDIQRICKSAAGDLTEELVGGYKKAINAFYAGYHDNPYRTYSSRNAYQKSKIMAFDFGAMGGISVDASYIGSPYRADTDWVFNRVFNRGIHGYTNTEAAIWTARQRMRGSNLTFHPTTSPTSPPPSVIMEKEYNRICSKGHMGEVCAKYFP